MTPSFIPHPLPTRPVRPRSLLICSAAKPSPPRRTLLSRNLSILPTLVRTARFTWRQFWRIMMAELAPSDAEGRYMRPASPLAAPPPSLEPESNYAVYVGVACQWCHRVLLALALLRLENVDVRYVVPGDDGLWKLTNKEEGLLRDVYLEKEPGYTGRFTAPLMMEPMGGGGIVSNESADILRSLGDLAGRVNIDEETTVWLRPRKENEFGVNVDDMDRFCVRLYDCVNNGVYRCGFATSQKAYEEAQNDLFECLDDVEARLQSSRFLFSPVVITEADVRLFPTVFRFDAVYALLFKASRKTIRADYPAISAWIRDIYNMSGVPETCDLAGTRENYFTSLFPLNPSGIVPVTPVQDLSPAPTRRGLGVSATVP